MLSIIWSILKIIGILLLVILGLILAVLLIVLFVPVRYECKGAGAYEQEPGAGLDYFVKARVSWLLRILTVRVQADKAGFGVRVKIFGIPVLGMGIWEKKKKRKKEARPGRRKRAKRNELPEAGEELLTAQSLPGESDGGETGTPEVSGTEKEEQTILSGGGPETEGGQEELLDSVDTGQDGAPGKAAAGPVKRLFIKIKALFGTVLKKLKALTEGIKNVFQKIKGIFSGIRGKIKTIGGKAGAVKEFLAAKENKEAVKFLLESGKQLLKQVLPRKLSGAVRFGLADPAATGKVLMILSMGYPFLKDGLQVTPVFENRTTVSGELYFKGRIRAVSLLRIAGRVWFNKKFKAFVKRGRRLAGELSA